MWFVALHNRVQILKYNFNFFFPTSEKYSQFNDLPPWWPPNELRATEVSGCVSLSLVVVLIVATSEQLGRIPFDETSETYTIDFIEVFLHEAIESRAVDLVEVLLNKAIKSSAINFVEISLLVTEGNSTETQNFSWHENGSDVHVVTCSYCNMFVF